MKFPASTIDLFILFTTISILSLFGCSNAFTTNNPLTRTRTNPPFVVSNQSNLNNRIPTESPYQVKENNVLFTSTLPGETDTEKETVENQSKNNNNEKLSESTKTSSSFSDRVASSGVASAAAMATVAVNAAVAMKSLEAPDVTKSYIAIDKSSVETDLDGLPLVYDKNAIESYWKKERGALNQRWSYFVGKAVPFLTKLVTLFITEGKIEDRHIPGLSKQARLDLQDLGPTFIKAGQMMSVRPDVLPQSTLDELTKLQDAVIPFSTEIAVKQIEAELNAPLGQYFSSISEEPVAAASLAQVYLATLNDEKQTKVAVKVQRPDVLSTVSKDLYVLRRAAEVFQGLVERFAPQQRTNYVALLNEWAIGFYTELDFKNEAENQKKLRQSLIDNNIQGVTVPKVFDELCTRRILVSEWMDGVKLSQCSLEEIANITSSAQEAFLTQLFEIGFFHADPHPGNILKLNEPTEEGHTVALIDCGLMASIDPVDRDNMINAVIHLANKDYASLVDDFMDLNILPRDSDRATIIPLMDKALSPYVKGGGAKKYEEELKKLYGMEDNNLNSQVGGFQAMTQDALTVLQDVPFSIPPYFAILGRAIVTLEGVALTGNPDYGIIMESYPFIARKLLREDRPEIQRALQEVLYNTGDETTGGLKFTRLIALLNNAAGEVGKKEGGVFVDLDAIPDDGGISFSNGLKYLLSEKAANVRALLEEEFDNLLDIFLRQILRRGSGEAFVALTVPRPPVPAVIGDVFSRFLPQPKINEIPLPLLLPSTSENTNLPSIGMLTLDEFVDIVAPKLSREEEIYALSLADATQEFLGEDIANLLRGEGVLSMKSAQMVLNTVSKGNAANVLLSSSGVSQNLLNEDVIQQITSAVANLFNSVRGSNENNNESMDEIFNAIDELDDEEKKRLDDLTTKLIERSLNRAKERLMDVPRIL